MRRRTAIQTMLGGILGVLATIYVPKTAWEIPKPVRSISGQEIADMVAESIRKMPTPNFRRLAEHICEAWAWYGPPPDSRLNAH